MPHRQSRTAEEIPFEWRYPPEIGKLVEIASRGLLLVGGIEQELARLGVSIPEKHKLLRLKGAYRKILALFPMHPRLKQWREYRRTRTEYAGGWIGPLPSPGQIGHGQQSSATLLRWQPGNTAIYLESSDAKAKVIEERANELGLALLARDAFEAAARGVRPPHKPRGRGQRLDSETRKLLLDAVRRYQNFSNRLIANTYGVDEKTVRDLRAKPIS